MAGLGQLDSLAYNLMADLIDVFGGTGKIEINNKTASGGFSGQPTNDTVTYDNIAITPPGTFITDTRSDKSIRTQNVEVYVSAKDVPTQPIAQKSFLTIYKSNFVSGAILNSRLKITEANPVMGGNSVAGYQLICDGVH